MPASDSTTSTSDQVKVQVEPGKGQPESTPEGEQPKLKPGQRPTWGRSSDSTTSTAASTPITSVGKRPEPQPGEPVQAAHINDVSDDDVKKRLEVGILVSTKDAQNIASNPEARQAHFDRLTDAQKAAVQKANDSGKNIQLADQDGNIYLFMASQNASKTSSRKEKKEKEEVANANQNKQTPQKEEEKKSWWQRNKEWLLWALGILGLGTIAILGFRKGGWWNKRKSNPSTPSSNTNNPDLGKYITPDNNDGPAGGNTGNTSGGNTGNTSGGNTGNTSGDGNTLASNGQSVKDSALGNLTNEQQNNWINNYRQNN